MKRHLRRFLTGILVVVPFAITVWVISTAGGLIEGLGVKLALKPVWSLLHLQDRWPLEGIRGVGAIVLLVAIYLIGLLTEFWLFRKLLGLIEAAVLRIPGVKVLYQSVRDLTRLFDTESGGKMGRVVEYCPPGWGAGVLGILTNEHPAGDDGNRVAMYMPTAFNWGGPVLLVPREHLREVDMPVEQALKLCATAQVAKPADH